MNAMHSGYDIIQTNPGVYDKFLCRVCNEEMEVHRNINGPTSYAESLSGGKHLHDNFICKNYQQDWHVRARKLKQQIESTPSNKISMLLQEELNEILAKRCITKIIIDERL